MAMPGLLLTGWAPALAAVRTVHLHVSDVARGPDAQALRDGVELGLHDAQQASTMLRVSLVVHRGGAGLGSGSGQHVLIIVAERDDESMGVGAAPCATRVYTCALRQRRADDWSVASRPVPFTAGPRRPDWHPALVTPPAAQLSARFADRFGVPMTEPAWRGWMAAKAAFEMALRAGAGEDDPLVLRLDGHKGQPLRFSEDGHLVQPTCRVVAGRAALVAPAHGNIGIDAG